MSAARRARRWTSAAVTALALVLALGGAARSAPGVRPETTVYRVRPGDTLQLIAAEFYGDRNKAIFIMVENKITHPKPLRPGERLRIPVSREITTGPEDTWESLAETYLLDKRRAPFLATFNKTTADRRLPAGTTLHVPFTVTHTADATETLASISAAYFGDAKQAEMLRQYNFLQRNAIERSESILVPVYNVRLQEAKRPPADSQARQQQELRRAATNQATTALPKAWQAWRTGDYANIEQLLGDIPVNYLDTDAAVDVLLLRGLAFAAEEKTSLAEETFKKLLERKPGHALRRFDYSPKLLAVWQKALGKVE